jgi:hypothetical protein
MDCLTEAQAECLSAHGLDSAAAVNGRLARAKPSSRRRLASLVDDLAASKLRRVADSIVSAGVQVVLVGGPLGSGTRGVSHTLAAFLGACAMPTKVLSLTYFLKNPKQQQQQQQQAKQAATTHRGGFLSSANAIGSSSSSGGGGNNRTEGFSVHGLHGLERLGGSVAGGVGGGGGVDSAALGAAVGAALAGAQASGLRCLIIEGVHALDPTVRGERETTRTRQKKGG